MLDEEKFYSKSSQRMLHAIYSIG
jgi:signal transduction histidine kinase/CheY-like chemotaxis protein